MSSQDWVALAAVWVALITTGTFLLCVFTLPHHLLAHPSWRRARREYTRQRDAERRRQAAYDTHDDDDVSADHALTPTTGGTDSE